MEAWMMPFVKQKDISSLLPDIYEPKNSYSPDSEGSGGGGIGSGRAPVPPSGGPGPSNPRVHLIAPVVPSSIGLVPLNPYNNSNSNNGSPRGGGMTQSDGEVGEEGNTRHRKINNRKQSSTSSKEMTSLPDDIVITSGKEKQMEKTDKLSDLASVTLPVPNGVLLARPPKSRSRATREKAKRNGKNSKSKASVRYIN